MDATTTITFKHEYGEYSITINEAEMTLDRVLEVLVSPVLRAAGYHFDNIEVVDDE